MNVKIITVTQHITAALTFLTGLIFGILNLCGIAIQINESDINALIFALGSLIAIAIELIPFIIKTIKDKNLIKIMNIVNKVVAAVEELKELSGGQKKGRAMAIIKNECVNQGLNINNVDIDNLVEAAVALYNKVVK